VTRHCDSEFREEIQDRQRQKRNRYKWGSFLAVSRSNCAITSFGKETN
jgi:hypothetical protein